MRPVGLAVLAVALTGLGPASAVTTAAEPLPALEPLDHHARPSLVLPPLRTAPQRGRLVEPRVVPRRAAPARGRAGRGQVYYTGDGNRVRVAVDGYRSTRADVQSFVDFLGEKVLHGPELSRLRIVIEPPRQVARNCDNEDAAACYSVPDQVMRIPGEDDDYDLPLAFVITHEYGHHVAYNRSNAPFPSLDFGPKRWATAEGVCPKWFKGQLFPGEEKDPSRYLSNPGEAWAEAFAVWHYRGYAWAYTALLRPDGRSLRAVREDVRRPWRRLRVRSLRLGTLGPGRRRAVRTLSAPLDGTAAVRVRTRGDLRVSSRVLHRGRLLAPTRGRSLRAILVCGARTLQLRVTRVSGRGEAWATVATP